MKPSTPLIFAALFASLLFSVSPVKAANDTAYLTVQGSGQVTAQPDAMTLSITVETQGETPQAVRQENSRKMNAVLQHLKQLRLPAARFTTASITVMPRYENNSRQEIIGYTAENTLEVKEEGLPAERLSDSVSKIMDTAISEGANHFEGPDFYLAKPAAASDEALKLAVESAHRQAVIAAEAAGLHLGQVQDIQLQSAFTPYRRRSPRMMRFAAKAADAAPTPVESGDFDISASVTIRYALLP